MTEARNQYTNKQTKAKRYILSKRNYISDKRAMTFKMGEEYYSERENIRKIIRMA
jgi:hypothetical protein